MMFYCIINQKDEIMKKLLYISLIIPLILVAGLNVDKISKILADIKSVKKDKILTFFNSNKNIHLKQRLKLTSKEKADIILFPKTKSDKIVIVDSYRALQINKNSIGAIYLKKGRTQIIFIEERLKKRGLTLSDPYNKHLLSECQINPVCLLSNVK